MATYTYRCPNDGLVDTTAPIGTAPASVPCPRCAEPSTRVITAPRLALADRTRMAALDRAEASRTEPAVVAAPPPRPGTPPRRPSDPRTRLLPRP